MTYDEIRSVVGAVSVELGTTLTLGYIGNSYPGYDDRWWKVWFEDLPRGLGEQHSNNVPSLTVGPTKNHDGLTEFELRVQLKRRWAWLNEKMHSRKVQG